LANYVVVVLITAWHRPQFSWHEMVGRPRSSDGDLAILEMPGSSGVSILVFGNGAGIDQVGEIHEHLAGFRALADHVFFQGTEEFVHLHGERPGLGLALAVATGMVAQLAEILAADSHGHRGDHFLQCSVFHEDLDVHFRLTPQAGHTLLKSLAISAHRAAQCFVRVKYGSKTKRQHGQSPKALADDARMLDDGLLSEGLRGRVFADNHCEISTGIGQNRGVIYALKALDCKWASGPATTLQ